MIAKNWRTSERKYGVHSERDVSIPMSDGIKLDCDVFHPDDQGKFPAILGVHAYEKSWQSSPSMPIEMTAMNASVEAGDSNFYVRRGYAHVIVNVRGSGKSDGEYLNYGPREVQDIYEVIEWIAGRPWCDGNVAMLGASYFAVIQKLVAALNPPHLKAIFAPFGYTDFYRDKFYHGGILSYTFLTKWANGIFRRWAANRVNAVWTSWTLEKLGPGKFKEAIAEALQDREINHDPSLVEALNHPEEGANPLIVDILVNKFDGEYFQERKVRFDKIKVPIYHGACWGMVGLHLPGEFRAWENIRAPKKMVIGPPIYLDRPVYQYQYESLRWFDHWLKGVDNGIMEEPPVRLFIMGANKWKTTTDWPLPETKWTPFYLHTNGLLSEHEFWPDEGTSSFEDNPFNPRGSLEFLTPPMVEETEVIGPIALTLYASTTDDEVLWFVSLWDVDQDGGESFLTRGWLRGSQRAVDLDQSKPWEPYHPHTKREHLKSGDVYEFNIKIVQTANLFKQGHRIKLKISGVDEETPKNFLEGHAQGHVWRQTPSWITIYHDADHPSCLLLPITDGNIIGTYMSGGSLYFDV